MIFPKLCDGSFLQAYSFGMAGEAILQKPYLMEWDRSPGPGKVKVFTDAKLTEAWADESEKKIALLLESPAIRPGMYKRITEMEDVFDHILTFKRDLVEKGDPYLFYPLGGTWIREWYVRPKYKMVSILLSAKTGQVGHRLRHEAAKRIPGVDAFGAGVSRWVDSKVEALGPYRFSIVIENTKEDWYFTEKLVDCIAAGSIPLYWGCPSIGDFFDRRGIITWDTIDELQAIVKSLNENDFIGRESVARENLERARKFACPEDWIVSRYPGLLG